MRIGWEGIEEREGRGKVFKGNEDEERMRMFGLLLLYSLLPLLCNSALCVGLHISYFMFRVSCFVFRVSCFIFHVLCFMSHTRISVSIVNDFLSFR